MKRKRIIGVLMTALLMAAMMYAAVFANEIYAYDSTDEARNGSAVPFNTNVSGQITFEDRTDYYKVDLPESGRLSVNVHSDIKKLDLKIYDSNDDHLTNEFPQKGDNTYTFDLSAGTYYLNFDEFIGTGDYSFSLDYSASGETYTEENDTIDAVRNTTPVPFGKTINGMIALNDKTDYFKVDLAESGRLSINVHSDIKKLDLKMYDSNDEFMTNEYPQNGDNTYTYDLAAGIYYLNFDKFNGTGAYSFSLDYTASGETYTEENNTIDAVRNKAAVPFGKTINGLIAFNDRKDIYKVELTGSGRLSINVHSDITKMDTILYDSYEEFVAEAYPQKGDNTYIYDLSAGTYFLVFDKYSGTGAYSFSLNYKASGETYTEENNTIDAVRNAASIPFAKKIRGQIALNDSYDYYKVAVSKSVKLKIKVHSDIAGVGIDLYDSDGYNTTLDYSMPKGDKVYKYTLAKGTYFLRFSKNDGTGNYSFTAAPSVSRPSFASVAKGRKSIRLKWKKVSGANGYVIQYATNKNFTKGKNQKTIKNSRTTSKKIKKLKAKKRYYVRIRAYKTFEGKKYYSSWSKVRIVKTK